MVNGKYLVVGTGALGVSGVGGTAVYMYKFREDTLELRVKDYFKNRDHMMVLSSSTQEEWKKFKDFYSHSSDEKPNGIGKEEISKWCEEKLSSRDSSSFELVKRWCVINTRSLKQEALATNRKGIAEGESDAAAVWKKAWTSYNTNKGNLDIKDSTFNSSSNNAEATEATEATGGPALQKWCEDRESKLMYEYLGEDKVYKKYHDWCTKG